MEEKFEPHSFAYFYNQTCRNFRPNGLMEWKLRFLQRPTSYWKIW